jgi:hypothetical protein
VRCGGANGGGDGKNGTGPPVLLLPLALLTRESCAAVAASIVSRWSLVDC